ncbi:MAG TPA: transglutaminase domain-containing protein [Vicinamibacteria bacterium]|nr:transglutaminase domain-containing protein [Vicinamibacteria bacterium]
MEPASVAFILTVREDLGLSLLRPIPRRLGRALSAVAVLAWVIQMGVLFRSIQASSPNLASDLARYGSSAQWKGVYSRGEKIGFMVGQTVPTALGYELQEEGRLQMRLLGATSAVRLRTAVQVDKAFELRSFQFSMDPGTGPIQVEGTLDGRRLHLTVRTPSGTRTETRELDEKPALSLNLSRRLAAAGLEPGKRIVVPVFDPATLRNDTMVVDVQAREVVRAAGRPVPAFKVLTRFAGITSTSWVTDTGEVVREESPLGLLVVKETPERATALAVPGDVQIDLLEAAAVVPNPPRRIDEPTAVERLVVRLDGVDLSSPEVQGAGQTVTGNVVEVRDAETLVPEPSGEDLSPHLRPELFIESDAPEIVAEARKAAAGATEPRVIAERLVRHVNALLEKKPTVSLPSAAEVLRTRVGDCNEHTALYVAMARALGVPARIAVGLVYLQGGFYYHAWPEVYIQATRGHGLWLPVDPTLDQFPADSTHIRLARGGLDRQAAILPAIGRARMRVLEVAVKPGSTPVLVGRPAQDLTPLDISIPRRDAGSGCWSQPS